VILVTSRKRREFITIKVGDHYISSRPAIKYLGIMIDARLSFKDHLDYASKKAAVINNALTRLMLNTGRPGHEKRKLLSSVVTSVLHYGSLFWTTSTDLESYVRGMASVYRLTALREACAFRTVSSEAVSVIAGMLPIDIMSRDRQRRYVKDVERNCMKEWQQHHPREDELIHSIQFSINQEHGEINYLTQFLPGRG